MINIAFVIDAIESPTGGTEKQLLMLIKHLDRSRFKPYLCVLRVSDWIKQHFCECELVDIGVPSFTKLSSYLNIIKFARFLKRRKIDIVQTHFVDANKVGVLAGKLACVKAILSTRRNQGYWHNKREVLIVRFLNTWVTSFLANSENTRQWTAKTEHVDAGRIKVIHNALEIERYSKASEDQRSTFRESLGFPAGTAIVGVIANLRPVKAIDVFIKAAKSVSERCPQARFIVVGEGPEKERLGLLCVELGVAPLVRFLGKRLDIPEILGAMDIGVLSSSTESFSNAIVEYMAAGLPCVCTDVGGAREAIEDGKNGYVIASGDHEAMADGIVAILASGDIAAQGKSRDKAAKLFSVSAIMPRYEQYYEEVVKA